MDLFAQDVELLRAFREGDGAALTKVYWHYAGSVTRVLRSGFAIPETMGRVMPIPTSERGDALQEVFCRAFAPAARLAYDGIRPYEPYLLRIARNYMIDRHRSCGGRQVVVASGELEGGGVEVPEHDDGDSGLASLEQAVQSARARDIVAGYIATCDRELARFIELRFVGEQGQTEVAAAMGCSRRRVRTLEARVVKGLRAYLRRCGHVELLWSSNAGKPGPVVRPVVGSPEVT